MPEIADASVDLVVTSPPYWQIKDYGTPGQIGWGQTLHEYLYDLTRVWAECARVLKPGRRLCVNIGDQFARALIYGRYKIIPLHAEVIAQAQAVGLDYLGAIIWQKKTTMNTSGGAVVMGSFPFPPNGIVELDYEYILLFKKPGAIGKIDPERKSASRLTTEEWKQFFLGHWAFGGVRQGQHDAMFPDELPRRLIRMFSFVGDTVLDPFLGSGTTAKVARELDRNAIGYELNPDFLPLIADKLTDAPFTVQQRTGEIALLPPPAQYLPQTEDARPLQDPKQFRFGADQTYKVRDIVDEHTLRMDTGLAVSLLGVRVPPTQAARTRIYFEKYLRGKSVILRFDSASNPTEGTVGDAPVPAYVQLANKLFINRKMIEMGLANADRTQWHKYRDRFIAAEEEAAVTVHES
jgi:DNA modification methylase